MLSIDIDSETLTNDRAASASLFPVGWRVQDRIGWTISRLHGPVPQWREKIGHSVNK